MDGIPAPNPNLASSLRILVADDSALSRKIVEFALTDSGYDVLFAKSGKEALRILAQGPVDILITDWVMDDFSGPDLCRRARADFADRYTYLVLLTSHTDTARLSEGLAAGADDYLTKPFNPDELRARVGVGRRVVNMHRNIESCNRQLMLLARTDPLTGLANRRAVEEWGIKQVAGALRHGYPLWVLLADVHVYTAGRDRFGRAAGDKILRTFASIVKKNTRVSDMSAHLGGDQFVLVVSHVDKTGVLVLITRLRKQMAAARLFFDHTTLVLDATFAIAAFDPTRTNDWDALISEADASLLEAKRAVQRRSIDESIA